MSDLLALAEELGTAAVSDVLDGAGIAQRRAPGLAPVTTPRVVAGHAVTVQVVPLRPGEPRPERHLCAAAVEEADEQSLVVVSVADEPTISGAWGGLLSLAAHVKGVRATVVDGLCRDSDEIRGLGYPVFARGTTPLTARGRVREQAHQVEVDLAGARVRPGDLVVADSDGVLVLDDEARAALEAHGPAMRDKEARFAARIRDGESLGEVLGVGYESLTAQAQEGREDG